MEHEGVELEQWLSMLLVYYLHLELLLLQKLQMGNISATTRIKHSAFPGCPEYPYAKSGFGVLGKEF